MNRAPFGTSITKQAGAFAAVWLLTFGLLLGASLPVIRRYDYGPVFTGAVLVAFALQLGLYLFPGFPALRARFDRAFSRRTRALVIGVALFVPYVIYGAGTHAWSPLPAAKLAGLAIVVLGLYSLFPVPGPRLAWQDVLAMLAIAVPVYVGFYSNIFPAPVYLDVMARLFVVALAAFAMLSLRGLARAGYEWRPSAGDWLEGGKQLVVYSVIALPLGFAMHFIRWHPKDERAAAFGFSFIAIFLFIAVAEELFFRGMLQNLLETTLSSKYSARAIASAIFGLSHIHHGFPNWRYVIMAAIAGWFYGTAWHNRRSLMASCVTHAAVDALWRHFFTV